MKKEKNVVVLLFVTLVLSCMFVAAGSSARKGDDASIGNVSLPASLATTHSDGVTSIEQKGSQLVVEIPQAKEATDRAVSLWYAKMKARSTASQLAEKGVAITAISVVDTSGEKVSGPQNALASIPPIEPLPAGACAEIAAKTAGGAMVDVLQTTDISDLGGGVHINRHADCGCSGICRERRALSWHHLRGDAEYERTLTLARSPPELTL